MSRVALLVLASLCAIYASGCGGSSNGGGGGGGTGTAFTVLIQPTRVTPKTNVVPVGSTIQFLNQAQVPVQVVSGTLDPSGNVNVVHLIVFNGQGFTPTNTTANLGDTIRFSNQSMSNVTIDIVDDDGQVISTITIPQGREVTFPFPSAGQFTIRQSDITSINGTVTLFGTPNPSNQFTSAILSPGGTFTVQFPNAGTFPYFIQDTNNPDHSFIIGTIVVQ